MRSPVALPSLHGGTAASAPGPARREPSGRARPGSIRCCVPIKNDVNILSHVQIVTRKVLLRVAFRHKSQERRGSDDPAPKPPTAVRGSAQHDKVMRDGLTPVRISRKELRRMSDDELSIRKSAVGHDTILTGGMPIPNFVDVNQN